MVRDLGLSVDSEGFDSEMQAQRERARAAGKFNAVATDNLSLEGSTQFSGYDNLVGEGNVIAILADGESVDVLKSGERGTIILDSTSFYGESGGQVGDQGVLSSETSKFMVEDCTKKSDMHLHQGQLLNGEIKVGDVIASEVDAELRKASALNHSATHLLHEALRLVVGDHVQQKGSLVDPDKLRFDFSHFEGVTDAQIAQVETMVNQQIMANTAVVTREMDIASAKALGAQALFGEKYSENVRVVSMGTDSFSIELCGGTHAKRTGDIALLKIKSEGGIASGVRRIEAVTGNGALSFVTEMEQQLSQIGALVKGPKDMLLEKVKGLSDKNRALEKQVEQMQSQISAAKGAQLINNAVEVNGVQLLVETLDADPKSLRETVEQLKNKLGNAIVVLASVNDGRVSLVAGVAKALTKEIKAGDIIKDLSAKVSGKGGGRPDMAQGGGTDASALPAALSDLTEQLKNTF